MKKLYLLCLLLILLVFNSYLVIDKKLINENLNVIEQAQIQIQQTNKVPKKYQLKENEIIGNFTIIGKTNPLPIYYKENQNNLTKGITLDEKHKLINEQGQSILAGHRETFFKSLKHIKEKDIIEIYYLDKNYTYEVFKTFIVSETEPEKVYKQTKDNELVLITCYPFEDWQLANKRFIVYAKLINES